jgi:outer membrane protein assembly factor BamE (lipoprotein component of BamABCDE complex)
MKRIPLITVMTAAVLALCLGGAEAQLGGGLLGGGGFGSRLETLRNRMTNKDPSIQYNPSVLRPGTPRSQVLDLMGQPNGAQVQNGVQQDVYAFFPDGSKYVDPQITAGTIAAAVFTGGMSLAVKAAKNTIQQNQLTLYDVTYDANDNIQSVQVIPPNIGSEPASSTAPPPSGGQTAPNANW